MSMMPRPVLVVLLASLAASLTNCRCDPQTTTPVGSGEFGDTTQSGWMAQCSGWFPDWISPNPPPAGVESFQLSQGYPLGLPVFETVGNQTRITGWNPFPPAPLAEAPWLAHDFHDAAGRIDYLNTLRDYVLEGMPEVDFVAQKNPRRLWYHVPMMTTNRGSRREPYHGMTKERPLSSSQNPWIHSGQQLDSFAIGYYNLRGGYALGQVFKDPNPALSDPSKAQFIDGTVVFKILFAEYDPAKIDAAQDPLVDAPQWQGQDAAHPAAPLKNVRLIQLDIAVKDARSAQTGWVFATFVYDKRLTSEPVAWRRLTPVGLMWGNDPDVTAAGVGTLDEGWTNTAALPTVFQNHLGRFGRLNGPIDNPISSCISCHSTAQVAPGTSNVIAFNGVGLTYGGCSAQAATWFRNLTGSTPFGVMADGSDADAANGDGCTFAVPQPLVYSTDYSLQIKEALESSLARGNPNPCQAMAEAQMKGAEERPMPGAGAGAAGAGAMREGMKDRMLSVRAESAKGSRVKVDPELSKSLQQQDRLPTNQR